MSSFYYKAVLDPHDRNVASDRLRERLARRKLAELTPATEPTASTATERTVNDKEAAAMAMEAIRVILEKQQLAEYNQRTAAATNHALVVNKQREDYKLLKKSAMFEKQESKANPSTFAHKINEADNAEKRAIVHHTSSHYHMAGSVQFQRGVRVKGTVSRHSKQGMKLQAARVAAKNMLTAREDAKGQRSEGPKGLGKTKSKKKKKSAN